MPVKNRTIPFGYQYENGVLAINPPEAHTVQKVFTAYLSGEPLSKIAAHLTAKLVEYLPGYWKWDKARVKRLLDNANYIRQCQHQPADCGRGHQAVQGPGPLPPLRRHHGAADGLPHGAPCHLEMPSL